MCRCHDLMACCGCSHAVSRRGFLQGATVAAVAALGGPAGWSAEPESKPVRVALVFLANSAGREMWPYPDFDCEARHQEIIGDLRSGCPGVEFIPIVVAHPEDVSKAVALGDSVDGYLLYTVTLEWSLTNALVQLGQLGKPLLIADEFLGGSGVFLVGASTLCRQGVPAALVSTTRMEDLVLVARRFADLKRPGTTPASFAEECRRVYRQSFARPAGTPCLEDSLTLTPIAECVKQLRASRFLIVGAGPAGQEREYLGSTAKYVGFEELSALYEQVAPDEAAEWARRWMQQAERVVEPTQEWITKAGAMYLASVELMKKHGSQGLTMNCLGGFATGQLPAYPCLGFMQILDDGAQGVCEAMPDDSLSMLMARLLTGRPGYVSDPALDTSRNQIVYAHCMAHTKAFGPEGPACKFRIRDLHNRDPRGCCAQSFLPEGFMTTSFRTSIGANKMVIHQAKALANLDSDRGCRTQLVGEVRGDIEKLFYEWDRFGWHRVTVYGDVKEPLMEFGRALGLEIVEEA